MFRFKKEGNARSNIQKHLLGVTKSWIAGKATRPVDTLEEFCKRLQIEHDFYSAQFTGATPVGIEILDGVLVITCPVRMRVLATVTPATEPVVSDLDWMQAAANCGLN